MQVLSVQEILSVSGGDAAETRIPGQNSWGEWGGSNPEGEIWARCKAGQWVYCIYFALQ
ncbi:hypothetical protein [Undibacterium sp. TJN19]|uniref:hypothetical protein n=1 Tax=Undibacterium sp. TJN19 TaxID=3413055 RepID=UPI003BF37D08